MLLALYMWEYIWDLRHPRARRLSLCVILTYDERGARTTDLPQYCRKEAAAIRTAPREKTNTEVYSACASKP